MSSYHFLYLALNQTETDKMQNQHMQNSVMRIYTTYSTKKIK